MNPSQEKRAGRVFDNLLKEFDRLLRHGEPVIDEATGEHRTDANGKKIYRPLSAAKLARIQKFLEHHQVGRAAVADNTEELAAEAEREIAAMNLKINGRPVSPKLPPLSHEDDQATAG